MQETATNIDTQLEQYLDSYEAFARDCITIRDHTTSKLLPLEFNQGQRILHAIAEKMKELKGFIRILLLKSRRFGGSTYIEGRFYWRSSLNFNRNTFIVGHEERSTRTLYAMATLMQEQNPLAPETRKSNAQELIFDNAKGTGLKSQYELATAKTVAAGRSQGIHYLHDSEEAFWPDAETLLTGLLQCVPGPPSETEVFRESTANGCGNTFHKDVMAAYCEGKHVFYEEDGKPYAWFNPDTNWVLAFIPWFVHERYSMEFESEERKKTFIDHVNAQVFNKEEMRWVDSEAKKLQRKHDLPLEKLYWREWCIENNCNGSVEKFHQEYPSTVEEAFLSAGLNVFNPALCDDLEALCKPSILIGEVIDRMGKAKVRPRDHGHFSLWQKPNPDESYFLTVDSGGGIKDSQIKENREPDPTCIDVYNHRTGLQVAQWHGHIDYDMIGDLVQIIGQLFAHKITDREYRLPTACVELNNHGYTVVADLQRKTYPMYCAKPDEPGYIATKVTKPRQVDTLREQARDGVLQIRCKETVSEMRTYIEENQKFNAASGCHDERVDTAAMASQMMILLPITYVYDGGKKKEYGGIINWEKYREHPKDMGEYREVTVAR